MINSLVAINAILHNPKIQYDGSHHLRYIQALSELRLVTPQDSYEFFSPPLPYLFPSMLWAVTGTNIFWGQKLAQFFNILLSLGTTYYLIKTCQLISARSSLRLGALAFLGILPVYYKTFAFVRGEPYVVFFTVIILYYVSVMTIRKQYTLHNALILGVSMGLCALSRQWGILLFPAVFLILIIQWIHLPGKRSSIFRILSLCLLLIIIISAWFYLIMRFRFGSSIEFNRQPVNQFSFKNQPPDFYLGLSPSLLISKPVRPNFPNQFLPIFYSEVWGDYWGYFSIYGKDIRDSEFIGGYTFNEVLSKKSRPYWFETNYDSMSVYLGRVNLVALFPSAIALISLVFTLFEILRNHALSSDGTYLKYIYTFILLSIAVTMTGYFWFLIMYPRIGKGDTIKATYVLQVFPFLAVLVGSLLEYVEQKSPFVYRLILGGFCISLVHNLNAMVTHYY